MTLADATLRTEVTLDPAVTPARIRHLALILGYQTAGMAATWPLVTFVVERKMPASLDDTGYAWGMWWMAHHLLAPWQFGFTTQMAAPAGIYLGYSTIMPLAGIVMAPLTLVTGPGTSLMVLCAVTPGLLCYAMYRAARLWLTGPGAIAAGAFFGLSSALAWRDWFHLNVALGTMFIPLAIEAAIRVRRGGGLGAGAYLGLVLGGSVMINPQSFAIAVICAGAITLSWVIPMFLRAPAALYGRMAPLLAAVALAAFSGGLQLAAMAQQLMAGGATAVPGLAEQDYVNYGATLPSLFAPSPQFAEHGVGALGTSYLTSPANDGIATYGIVLTMCAILGAVVAWRRRIARWSLLGWLACSVLALGTSVVFLTGRCTSSLMYQGVKYGAGCAQYLPLRAHLRYPIYVPMPGGPAMWRPAVVSELMPYSWLIRLPLLSAMREADRFLLVGLVGAALLAGLAIEWLSQICLRSWAVTGKPGVPARQAFRAGRIGPGRWVPVVPLAIIAAAGILEMGWAAPGIASMPTTLPRIGQALLADHSDSIVSDVPFGIRGGSPILGAPIYPWELLTATQDGRPRSISYTAWIPIPTVRQIESHFFYLSLMHAQRLDGASQRTLSAADIQRARADFRALRIGVVAVWLGDHPDWQASATMTRPARAPAPTTYSYPNVARYLRAIGLRPTQVVCVAGPAVGCAVRDQVQIWR